MLNEARSVIRNERKSPVCERIAKHLLMNWIFLNPLLMHSGFRLLRLYQRSGLQRLVRNSRILKWFPMRLRKMESLLPEIPKVPRYPLPLAAGNHGQVLFFSGCIMPEIFGPIHEATVRVLHRNGVDVVFPARQTCCGALHLHDGDLETARRLARRNIQAFEEHAAATIVVNAAGCGASLKEYDELLAGDPEFAERARDFCRRVQDISEFLDKLGIDRNMERLDIKVAYDDPCHLLHAQKIKSAPRNLLRAIPGLQLVEITDADRCCGSAGVYNITHPEMSERILDEKIANIIRSGARVVATGNPGCLLQIRAGMRAKNQPIRVVHPIELLDQAYEKHALKLGKHLV
jgi:Fe-S oxidoreductase